MKADVLAKWSDSLIMFVKVEECRMNNDALLVVPGGAATWCMPSSSSRTLLIWVITAGVVLQTAEGFTLDVNCNKITTPVETIGPGPRKWTIDLSSIPCHQP
ncbi:hypothetical protein DAPPUDRAFT_111498 [Daphnia pulex]|uniref:Uncharacterized protein n=1 Tax=Daphnia pulex TaxID=6669 RepID=E9H9E5_DAPPU|nr:hypothetical protein DAPPUDRAFT_111498 [Daphnia pulex]|eukprot:EFX71668.1 hypothetical protein DAPPUDRAFT_111498 [Daphnia pulex]